MSVNFWPLLETLTEKQKLWRRDTIQRGEGLVSLVERNEAAQWLCEVCRREKFGLDSLCLAIAVMDKILCISRVQAKYLNCVALASLYMAVKLCEELESIPDCVQWLRRLHANYSTPELMRMERALLAKLDWDLGLPTVHRFLHLMLVICGNVCDNRMERDLWRSVKALLTHHQVVFTFNPAACALSALSLALEQTRPTEWFSLIAGLQTLFQIDPEELIQCRELVAGCLPSSINKENLPLDLPGKKLGKRARKRQRRSSRSSESDMPTKFMFVEDIADAMQVLYG